MTTTEPNRYAMQLIALATEAGLRPATSVQPYQGSREVSFSGPHPDAPYGVLRIGVRTGRVASGAFSERSRRVSTRRTGAKVTDLAAELRTAVYRLPELAALYAQTGN